MQKRIVTLVVLLAVILGGTAFPVDQIAAMQSESAGITVLAAEAFGGPVNAWTEAFTAAHEDASFEISLYADEETMMGDVAGADVVFYGAFEDMLPIEFECGIISRPYVVLPELGARYLSSTDCGEEVSEKTQMLQAFLEFTVSSDGQQIAIDLGLLPDVVEVVDQGGVTVAVPQPVRGIASAYGVATYYVYTTGAMDRILAASYIGVRGPAVQDTFRQIDPGFEAKMNAVSALNQREINVEELAALGPDLVLASARTQWIDTVLELGIPVLRFEGETPERLKDSMTLIGAVLGPDAAYRAALFNQYYDAQLAVIQEQTADIDPAKQVYFSGTEPLRTASGDMYQTAMIELAGGESVSAELTGFWNDVNLEQVLLWNPDVIFVPTYGGATVEAITESPEWAVIPAVENGEVYQLPQFISPWDTPLPDSILGIMWMAETLYPEQIELDCEAETTYFYATFYDYDVSSDELQRLCP